MGYSLFQSSLVLLQSIQHSSPDDQEDLLQHIQVNLSVLGAMRKLHAPARQWVRHLPLLSQMRRLKYPGRHTASISRTTSHETGGRH